MSGLGAPKRSVEGDRGPTQPPASWEKAYLAPRHCQNTVATPRVGGAETTDEDEDNEEEGNDCGGGGGV